MPCCYFPAPNIVGSFKTITMWYFLNHNVAKQMWKMRKICFAGISYSKARRWGTASEAVLRLIWEMDRANLHSLGRKILMTPPLICLIYFEGGGNCALLSFHSNMSFKDTVWKYFVLTEANKSCAHPIIKLEDGAVLRLISEMDRATLESLGRLNGVLKLKSDLFSRQRKEDLHSKVWFIFKDNRIVLISVSGAEWVIETLSGKYFVLTLTDGKEKTCSSQKLILVFFLFSLHPTSAKSLWTF